MLDIALMGPDEDFNLLLQANYSSDLIIVEQKFDINTAEFKATQGCVSYIRYNPTNEGLKFGGLLHELVHWEQLQKGLFEFEAYSSPINSVTKNEAPAYNRQAAFIMRNNLYNKMDAGRQAVFKPFMNTYTSNGVKANWIYFNLGYRDFAGVKY